MVVDHLDTEMGGEVVAGEEEVQNQVAKVAVVVLNLAVEEEEVVVLNLAAEEEEVVVELSQNWVKR